MNDTTHTPDPEDEHPTENDAEDTVEEFVETGTSGGLNAKPLLIVAVLVAILFFVQAYRKGVNRDARHEAELREAAISNSAVTLTVTWSNSKRLPLQEVKWHPGITVRDFMVALQEKGVLTFEEKGEGDAAIITSIGDAGNEGSGTENRNWIFLVEGKMADRSFATYELKKGDNVVWQYTTNDLLR